MSHLFNGNPGDFFDMDRLRRIAAEEVRRSSLIQRAEAGIKNAATALHCGFWPFVSEFEAAIDNHRLPRKPLRDRYGVEKFLPVFRNIAAHVRDMQQEEKSHAAHWKKDAVELGVSDLKGDPIPGVTELVESSYTTDWPKFFAVLAGTEFIAEELSRFLIASPRFTSLFGRKRWMWGEIHLMSHDDGPSHLEIDMDLARAYSKETGPGGIERMVEDTIRLFGKAARGVESTLLDVQPRTLAAAE